MYTGIPLFTVLKSDNTTYNGKGGFDLPKKSAGGHPLDTGNWHDAPDDIAPGEWKAPDEISNMHIGKSNTGFYMLTTQDKIFRWYKPDGRRLYLAEGAGGNSRRREHVIYKRVRLIREITIDDPLCDMNPMIYLFCALSARDRGETVVDLSRKDFSGLKLTGLDFRGFKLSGSDFTGSSLGNACFDECDLQSVNFTRCDCYETSFKGASMRGVNFKLANLFYADFEDADLHSAKFANSMHGFTKLINADLRDTLLDGVEIHLKGEHYGRTVDHNWLPG